MIPLETALLRLILALVLGALIGWERERGERGAGLRTNALVALGSSLIIIVSAFGFAEIRLVDNVNLDPSRMAAQVVSGIGFLGAGTILLRKEIVKGLTTAAAIWVVAAIGLACGAGLLLEAIATTVLTIIVLIVFQPLRQLVRRPSSVTQPLRIKVTAVEESLLNRAYNTCVEAGATIENVEVQTGNGKEKVEILCHTSDAISVAQSIVALRALPGVETVSINLRNVNNANPPFFLPSEEPAVR